MLPDLRYAIRALRASPTFTTVAVATLALGIGATTSIYSVVDTILLQPLPFTDSNRLVRIVENVPAIFPGRPPLQRGPNYQEFVEWRSRSATLAAAAAVAQLGQRMITTADGTFRLWGAVASANLFTFLGTRAQIGRTLGPGDAEHPDAVVISADVWRRLFHGDPAAIGTRVELRAPDPMFQGSVMLDGRLLTIVGVLPDTFEFPTASTIDFYTPLVPGAGRPPGVTMLGRLRPGVARSAAVDEANVIGTAIRPPRPANAPPLEGRRFDAQVVKDQIVQPLRPALRVLLIAVAAVLLIVCANVANLLLARGTARQREIAVRVAIGATRAHIIRLVFVECAILAVAGGAVGAAVAAGGVTLIRTLASIDAPGIFRLGFGTSILPRGSEVGVDLRMFGIAFGISALTSCLFGILPALHLSGMSHAEAMGARSASSGRGATRARSVLVVGQIVIATMLLIAAGLLVRSFVRLSAVDRGYDPSNVLALQLVFPADYSIPRKTAGIDAMLARLRTLPGVEAAGFTRAGLLIGEELVVGMFVAPGRSLEETRRDSIKPLVRAVSSGYLTAAGIRVTDGRDFNESDTAAPAPSIVVSSSVARRYFGAASPVGQKLAWHVGTAAPVEMEIVGVARDVRNTSPERAPAPEIWVEYHQLLMLQARWGDSIARQNELSIGFLSFAIRARGRADQIIPQVRRSVRDVDASAGIDAVIPMDRLTADSVARQRFNATMIAVFAAIAGVLAAVGIYGVLAYAVAQRRHEIGIRMALGARRGQVLAMVFGNGVALTAAGIAIGSAAAVAAGRALESLLFGITPLDAATYGSVALLFGIAGALASYLPARRASHVDPMELLRAE